MAPALVLAAACALLLAVATAAAPKQFLGVPQSTDESGNGILDVDPNDWLRQCVPRFKAAGFPKYINYTNYYLKDMPSGLCADALSCAFKECAWSEAASETLMAKDVNAVDFSDIEDYLPPLNLPSKIAFPLSVSELVQVVKFANAKKMHVSIKTSGHSYAGQSTSKDSLQLNLRSLPKYSRSSITECQNEQAEGDACKLALARGKHAVVRVGGGEVWDDVLRAVLDWNTAIPRNRTYYVLSGAAGTVSAAGGWMQGGGLSVGTERLYGIGVDQVLQLEMVLANGAHVKFGPTRWETVEGFLYPQTTHVEGKCNYNVHADESLWDWRECLEPVSFDKLWFAVRGGGGGTYGIVSAAHYNLHDEEAWYTITATDALRDVASTCESLDACESVKMLWIDFVVGFLWDPESLGVSSEISNHCGDSGASFSFLHENREFDSKLLYCWGGREAAQQFLEAWQAFVNSSSLPDDLAEALKETITVIDVGSWTSRVLVSAGDTGSPVPIGHVGDDPSPTTFPDSEGSWSLLAPKEWILQRDELVNNTLLAMADGWAKPHLMGGQVQVASDGMTAVSNVERAAAFQVGIPSTSVDIRAALFPYLTSDNGTTYLGGTELNHISPDVVGPLKSDWRLQCPSNYTRSQRKEKCMSLQESVWGTETFHKLEEIKKEFDPEHLFKCYFCVGDTAMP